MEIHAPSIFERFNTWIKESVTIKLASIGFLVLILLIPQAWIQSLINERQYRAEEVINEIAGKWSNQQTVSGPVLIVPFLKHIKIEKEKGVVEYRETKDNAFFLPEELKINGKVSPQILHRGIFESVVYESSIDINANFLKPDFGKLGIDAADILWSQASLVLGISDLRGINENPALKLGNEKLSGEPSNNIGTRTDVDVSGNNGPASESGITIKLPWTAEKDFAGNASFNLSLKGSSHLYFRPVGKTTDATIQGPWGTPGFDGEFLPASREVNESDFKANWKILHFNRPYAQQWISGAQQIVGSEFGVKLLIPVDQYQKSIRTAKYGVLVILLTFVALFMVEIIRKIRIHPVQYILVGSALIVYYILLLSLSEQFGYNMAYVIATVATIGLLTLYSISFLTDKKTVTLFSAWMVLFYGFIFVIIQEQDYSLLLGSVGLFLIISAIMYFSRKIRWYNDEPAITTPGRDI